MDHGFCVYDLVVIKLYLRPDLAEDRTHTPRGARPTRWYLSRSDSHWPDQKCCPTIETLAARPLASGVTTPSIPLSWINMWINMHAQQLSPVLLRHKRHATSQLCPLTSYVDNVSVLRAVLRQNPSRSSDTPLISLNPPNLPTQTESQLGLDTCYHFF